MSLGLLTRYGLTRAVTGGDPELQNGLSWTGAGTTIDLLSNNVGWEFKVDVDATVHAIRVYPRSSACQLQLWRVGVPYGKLAEVDATGLTANEWNEVAITPVALSSVSEKYVVTQWDDTDGVYRNQTGVTYNENITLVNTGVTGSSGGQPSNDSSSSYQAVDIVFAVD